MEKQCRKCQQIKLLTEFNTRKLGKDGYYNSCKICRLEYSRKESYKQKQKERDIRNIEINNLRKKKHRQENKQRYSELAKIHRKKCYNKNLEKAKERSKKWKKDNVHICIEYVRARNQKKKIGINTLSKDQLLELREIYKQCREMNKIVNKKYAVDHIIPLNHPNVCGLHAPWNLQILTSEENNHKRNIFDGTNANESWRLNLLLSAHLLPPDEPDKGLSCQENLQELNFQKFE